MGFRVSFMRLPAIVSLWKLLFDGDLQFFYFIVNHKKLQIQSDRLIEIGKFNFKNTPDRTMRLKHSSKQVFTKNNDSSKKSSRNTPKQAFLTFFYSSPRLTKIGLTGLNGLLYLIEKTPFLRDIIPLTDPAKNNMTYLAINENIAVEGPKVIPVHERLNEPVNKIMPRQVLDDMIDVFSFHMIMDKCICRLGFQCKNFTSDIGCLFMGETARKLPPGLGRRIDRRENDATGRLRR
jgi:hypothetical protein